MRISLLLPVLLLAAPALAQTPPPASPLPRLLAERRVLTQQYAAANAQRHSLFGLTGKASKKDLQDVVDALQGIVNKDEEIVATLGDSEQQARNSATQAQTTASTLQNTSRDDRNVTAQRLAELQNDQLNAQQREKLAATRQQALTADLAEARQGRTLRDAVIAGLAVACAALLLWRRKRR